MGNSTGGGWTRTSEGVSRGIYSPLQLPLCDAPLTLLEKGIEPSTVRLQIGCSTFELLQHSKNSLTYSKLLTFSTTTNLFDNQSLSSHKSQAESPPRDLSPASEIHSDAHSVSQKEAPQAPPPSDNPLASA